MFWIPCTAAYSDWITIRICGSSPKISSVQRQFASSAGIRITTRVPPDKGREYVSHCLLEMWCSPLLKKCEIHSVTPSLSKNCATVIHLGCSISRLRKSLSPVSIISTSDTMAAFRIGWSLASRISFPHGLPPELTHKTFQPAGLPHPAGT